MMSESKQECLAGMRVLDLSQFEAGPTCTEGLAWMGADVVKVESLSGGDPQRGRPPKGASMFSQLFYQFLEYNANKRSIALNLKHAQGFEVIKDLIRKSDVFIENFAPGTIERLGLGPDIVRSLNPSIIYCQIKGFGRGSTFEGNLAFDMTMQAAGGLMSITGNVDGPPCRSGASLADIGTGMVMCNSILAAYIRKLRSGEGAHLQVAMQDALLHYTRTAFAYTAVNPGVPAPRAGGSTIGGGYPPNGVFPCKGGGANDYVYIFNSPANPEHWNRLLKLIDREDLVDDARYSAKEARAERRDEVNALVAEWTLKHDKMEAMRQVGAAGVPAGAVMDSVELANDKTFEQRGMRQTIQYPELGEYTMMTWPVVFDEQPVAIRRAPMLGEHSLEVLQDWIGIDAARHEALVRDGVIG